MVQIHVHNQNYLVIKRNIRSPQETKRDHTSNTHRLDNQNTLQ
jgi:hypothetical protein